MQKTKRVIKHKRVIKKILGEKARLRIAVFKSNQHIYAQIIDDLKRVTLAQESDLKIKSGNKTEKAMSVGETLAKSALKLESKDFVFDRGGFKYHGRIAAVAEGLRKGGVKI